MLITLQPGDGHLPPMLPLSRALRAAGHEVVVATSPTFVSRVEAAGEPAIGAGLGWLLSKGPAQPAEPLHPGEHPRPSSSGCSSARSPWVRSRH
ncbi:MAG: hypothetical protein EA340_11145 [Nitriliruptor sp.]|nr:MAG: hypothetical protein EA340_11145 [Nitriliruptor sp.]